MYVIPSTYRDDSSVGKNGEKRDREKNSTDKNESESLMLNTHVNIHLYR